MKLINNFECIEAEAFTEGSLPEKVEMKHIKQETIRPHQITFKDRMVNLPC